MFGRGPHGPSMRYCNWEASQLSSQIIDSFSVICPNLSEKVKALNETPQDIKENWKKRFNQMEGTTFHYGKISRIPDKEGKTRVIAVTNF